MSPPVLGLSFHRAYGCRHAGACCTAGWTIPVEEPLFIRLVSAVEGGRLSTPLDTDALLRVPEPRDGYVGLVGTHVDGRCVFRTVAPAHADRAPGRCAIHERLGHEALPLACQQFPRVAVLRPGSIAVSLSHYCPSAAALLFDRSPSGVEDLSGSGGGRLPLDGLDMRDALPPLLTPVTLFSWAGFDRWERFVVQTLLSVGNSVQDALRVVIAAAEALRRWSIADGAFEMFVARTLEASEAPRSGSGSGGGRALRLTPEARRAGLLAVESTVPMEVRVQRRASGEAGLEPREAPDLTSRAADAVVRRYLAARAWASWSGHEGSGVRGYVRGILAAWVVLQAEFARDGHLQEAIRRADLLLVHHATPRLIARQLGRREDVPLPVDLL